MASRSSIKFLGAIIDNASGIQREEVTSLPPFVLRGGLGPYFKRLNMWSDPEKAHMGTCGQMGPYGSILPMGPMGPKWPMGPYGTWAQKGPYVSKFPSKMGSPTPFLLQHKNDLFGSQAHPFNSISTDGYPLPALLAPTAAIARWGGDSPQNAPPLVWTRPASALSQSGCGYIPRM
jgi:hypothetical protein